MLRLRRECLYRNNRIGLKILRWRQRRRRASWPSSGRSSTGRSWTPTCRWPTATLRRRRQKIQISRQKIWTWRRSSCPTTTCRSLPRPGWKRSWRRTSVVTQWRKIVTTWRPNVASSTTTVTSRSAANARACAGRSAHAQRLLWKCKCLWEWIRGPGFESLFRYFYSAENISCTQSQVSKKIEDMIFEKCLLSNVFELPESLNTTFINQWSLLPTDFDKQSRCAEFESPLPRIEYSLPKLKKQSEIKEQIV